MKHQTKPSNKKKKKNALIHVNPHTLIQLSAPSLQNPKPSKAAPPPDSPHRLTPQPFLRNQANPNLRRFKLVTIEKEAC